jgi:hypothetical protein
MRKFPLCPGRIFSPFVRFSVGKISANFVKTEFIASSLSLVEIDGNNSSNFSLVHLKAALPSAPSDTIVHFLPLIITLQTT